MREIFTTKGGVTVIRRRSDLDISCALDDVYANIDRAKGCILASDYEYPGRYSRWDIGLYDPPIELIGYGRDFTLRALNDRGKVLLAILLPAIEGNEHVQEYTANDDEIVGRVHEMPAEFPEEQRSKQPSIFSILRAICELMACDDEYLTMFGAFGYDLVLQFEPLNLRLDRSNAGADCHLFLGDRLYVIDHQKEDAFMLQYDFEQGSRSTVGLPLEGRRYDLPDYPSSTDVDCDHAPGEYADKVEQIRQGCKQGDFFEVVLSQVFTVKCGQKPMKLFSRLRKQNPSPYDFLINLGDEQLIGASPEMYVRVDGRQVDTCPISGTVKRGGSPMEDAEQIRTLLSSKKDESELTMCTDVDRNDKSRICVPGSVHLVGRRLIETYSKLFHTVDHVRGVLRDECDIFDALLTHMWAGTLTGAPKPRAMQMVEDLENSSRRWYGGCIGLFTFAGQLNTGTTIRTIQLRDGVAIVRAGATLLFDSDPVEEEKETRVKASAFLNAVTAGARGEPVEEIIYEKHKKGAKVLFVDNEDSFVHTLANYVRQTGVEVTTLRRGFDPKRLDEIKPDLVFISPGPGTPDEMGVPELVAESLARGLPVFGVCLGHQGIALHFGAEIGVLETPMHGKDSAIYHDEKGIFKNIPMPFVAGRYHSLFVKNDTVPDCLEVTAKTEDGVIMGIRHKTLPIASVQFHPESILTLQGDVGIKMIANVIELLA